MGQTSDLLSFNCKRSVVSKIMKPDGKSAADVHEAYARGRRYTAKYQGNLGLFVFPHHGSCGYAVLCMTSVASRVLFPWPRPESSW